MLTNFKKVFAHLLLCGYTSQKNPDYWHGKTKRQCLITAHLDSPRPLQLFLMQISSNLPILICFTNAVHATAFSNVDICLSDSTFPHYLLNRTLHLCYCFYHLHYRWNSLWNYGTWDPMQEGFLDKKLNIWKWIWVNSSINDRSILGKK